MVPGRIPAEWKEGVIVSVYNDSATPDVMVSEDVPMLHEVTRAIRRLKNGRAAGADGITAELLKGAEKPISEALHKVITNVWSPGEFQLNGKKALSSQSTMILPLQM